MNPFGYCLCGNDGQLHEDKVPVRALVQIAEIVEEVDFYRMAY